MAPSRACVVGLGRVGLPTAVLVAGAGLRVVGVDIDPRVTEAVGTGRAGADEPGLRDALRAALETGALTVADAPAPADVTVICVPTPLTTESQADLSHVHAAVSSVLPVLRADGLVLVESTVPPGTTEAVADRLRAIHPEVLVAHTPERVLPGDALREIVHNDRLVGGVDPASTDAAAAFLQRWVDGPLHRTDARTAELAKLAENAARDVHIALANELDSLAAAHGVDGWRLRALVNRHPRVRLLRPGPGVGGPCVPVDPWFLAQTGEARLLRAARAVNDGRPRQMVERVLRRRPHDGASIGLLGLTYKPDVADLTGSPALEVARQLARHADVRVHDPLLERHPDAAIGLELPLQRLDRVLACDLVVGLVAHRAYDAVAPPPGALDLAGLWRQSQRQPRSMIP